MTGVADDEADVVLFNERERLRYVLGLADVDGVVDQVAERAWLRDGMEGVASSVGEEGGHN